MRVVDSVYGGVDRGVGYRAGSADVITFGCINVKIIGFFLGTVYGIKLGINERTDIYF